MLYRVTMQKTFSRKQFCIPAYKGFRPYFTPKDRLLNPNSFSLKLMFFKGFSFLSDRANFSKYRPPLLHVHCFNFINPFNCVGNFLKYK